MFRYVFVIIVMMWVTLPLLASPDVPVSDDTSPTESISQGEDTTANSADEESDEPSLEEPSPGESNTFEAGAPPVTEESLEEEDSAEQSA